MINQNETSQIKEQIALWGPRGAGKSWLVDAFRQKINIIKNRNLSHGFAVELRDKRRANTTSTQVAPNQKYVPTDDIGVESYEFIFKSIKNYGDQINSFSQVINLIDAPGSATADYKVHQSVPGTPPENENVNSQHDHSAKPSGAPLPHQVAAIYQVYLRASNNILVVLDNPETVQVNSLSIIKALNQLCSEIESSGKPRRIAICLTKSDLHDIGPIDNEEFLKDYYANLFPPTQRQDLLACFSSFQQKHIARAMKIFSVSAMGYIIETSKRVPNYDDSTQSLRNRDLWNPENVEKPFFWFFDQIRNERLLLNKRKGRGVFYLLFGSAILKTREHFLKSVNSFFD